MAENSSSHDLRTHLRRLQHTARGIKRSLRQLTNASDTNTYARCPATIATAEILYHKTGCNMEYAMAYITQKRRHKPMDPTITADALKTAFESRTGASVLELVTVNTWWRRRQQEADKFTQEADLHQWTRDQNSTRGIAPTSRRLVEQRTAPTSSREHDAGKPHEATTALTKKNLQWIRRWARRWNIRRGKVRAGPRLRLADARRRAPPWAPKNGTTPTTGRRARRKNGPQKRPKKRPQNRGHATIW